jgi:uracil-DNA glycosylase family 4
MSTLFLTTDCVAPKCTFKKCHNIPIEFSPNFKQGMKLNLLIVGEAPGSDEIRNALYTIDGNKVRTKRPFIGKAGQLLRIILDYLTKEFSKKGVYFTYALSNVVKTRPTENNKGKKNRTPTKEEQLMCGANLLKEIKVLNPSIIVATGDTPYNYLTNYIHEDNGISYNRSCVRNIMLDNGTIVPIIGTPHTSRYLYLGEKEKSLIGMTVMDIWKAIKYACEGVCFNISNTFKTVVLNTVEDVRNVYAHFMDTNSWLACDTETSNLHKVHGNKLLTMQWCNDGHTGYVIPFYHKDSPFNSDQCKEILNLTAGMLHKNNKTAVMGYVFWNAFFDMNQLFRETHEILYNAPVVDAQYGEFLIEENLARLGMGNGKFPYALATHAWQSGFTHYDDNVKMNKENRKHFTNMDLCDWQDYAAADAIVTYNKLESQRLLTYHQDYYDEFICLMMNLSNTIFPLITYVSHCGFPIDVLELYKLATPRTSPIWNMMGELENDINNTEAVRKTREKLSLLGNGVSGSLYGDNIFFDIGKDEHKQMLFFDVMGLEPISFSPKKKRADGSDSPKLDKEFKKVYSDIDEVKLWAEFERLKGLKGMFIKPLIEYMTKPNGNPDFYTDYRIRMEILTRKITGRLGMKNPNMQQRVSHGDHKNVILSMFRASPNKCIIKIDFSAHEVRGLQIISEDPEMAKMFNQSRDIKMKWRQDPTIMSEEEMNIITDSHIIGCSIFFEKALEEFITMDPKVRKGLRNDEKGIWFGCAYGMSDKSLGISLGKSEREAKRIKGKMFDKAHKAKQWLYDIEKFSEENLYVQGPLGVRRRLWAHLFPDSYKGVHGSTNRDARNAPIQGMSSFFSLMSGKMILDWIYSLGKGKYQVPDEQAWFIINLIHDSVEFEIPVADVGYFLVNSEYFFTDGLLKHLKDIYDMNLTVPFAIDTDVGIRMDNMKKWNGTTSQLNELCEWLAEENQKQHYTLNKG